MLQPRLPIVTAASRASSLSAISLGHASLLSSFFRLNLTILPTQSRSASHASQGRANKAAPGPGKRLGAKKSDSEPVVPGNIIFRQRGSLWFPGENCVMGRDHTISANAKGFVRYYRDPERDPKKKYIGVVFEQHEMLPRPRNAARRRRLGMDTVVMKEPLVSGGERLTETVLFSETSNDEVAEIDTYVSGNKPQLSLREGYQYRESNWSIGRTIEREGINTIPPFDPKNRWVNWRHRMKKRTRAIEAARTRTNLKKGKGKAKAKAKGKGRSKI